MSALSTQTLKISRVVFQNDNFVIFKTTDGVGVKGKVLDDPNSLIGQNVAFSGKWETDTKYGKTFSFVSYEAGAISVFYFLTNIVTGIGAKLAKDIIGRFGEDAANIIERSPSQLLTIPGIKEKKLKTIVESWTKFRYLRKLSEALSKYGVTNGMIIKLYDRWGDQAMAVLEDNPYRIAELDGVGFKRADEIALNMGVSHENSIRIDAGTVYIMEKYMSSSGHSIVEIEEMKREIKNELAEDGELFILNLDKTINRLISKNEVIKYSDKFFTITKYDRMENCVVRELIEGKDKRGATLRGFDLNHYISAKEKEMGIVFGEKQKEAIMKCSLPQAVFFLGGYAGSGKTSVTKAILGMYGEQYGHDQIMCCALAGVAANKAKIQSGFDGQTIHSMLGQGANGFKYNEGNKLPYKVIVVDEASMISLDIFYHFIKAVDLDYTKVIFIGDPAQLPPVGAGNVFGDLIDSGLMPSVILDVVYRQNEKQAIPMLANQIREGVKPSIDGAYADFKFEDKSIEDYWKLKQKLPESEMKQLREKNNGLIVEYIYHTAKNVKVLIDQAKTMTEKLSLFQVLSPIKAGALGVVNLNSILQDAINPDIGQSSIKIGDVYFRKNDKVIQTINKEIMVVRTQDWAEYKSSGNEDLISIKKVYNGQIGMIMDANAEEGRVVVGFPFEGCVAIYAKNELNTGVISHAFAMSIHKSQGSEFRNVLMPITSAHSYMLSPKLLYTALTRAKTKMIVVGEKNTFISGSKHNTKSVRRTISSEIILPKCIDEGKHLAINMSFDKTDNLDLDFRKMC